MLRNPAERKIKGVGCLKSVNRSIKKTRTVTMKENETKWYFAAKQYEKCDMAVKLGCTA
jgi:hypothetical protein